MLDYKQIFDAMTSDPRYQRNLDWGEARWFFEQVAGKVRSNFTAADIF